MGISQISNPSKTEAGMADGPAFMALVSGFGALVSYLIPTMVPMAGKFNAILFVFFGFFLSLFIVSFYRLAVEERSGIAAIIGTVLLILAGCIHSIMAAMQASLRAELPGLRAALGAQDPELLRVLVNGLSSIQIGVDFAFDLFISAGVAFWSIALWRRSGIFKIVSTAGVIIAAAGFSFNLIAFPENPGSYGLMDPGALFGAWFTALWILTGIGFIRSKMASKAHSKAFMPTE